MRIGLWNLDHPEVGSGRTREESRFREVVRRLERSDCDLLITTEAVDDTVQHVVHSPDLEVDVELDFSVQHTKGGERRLSDHPFLSVTIRPRENSMWD